MATIAGRPNEARILLEGALAIALEHDLHAATSRAYNNLGWALETQDRLGRQTTCPGGPWSMRAASVTAGTS